jgi:sorbitol/mannitol transport system substrate-binding protein
MLLRQTNAGAHCFTWGRALVWLVLQLFVQEWALAASPERVCLATVEQPPYVGKALTQNGASAEIVRAAFALSGYQVEIGFYPAARARELVLQGMCDALFPVGAVAGVDLAGVKLSNPFPGPRVGLLKRRGSAIPYGPDSARDPLATLNRLGKLRIGAVRGASQGNLDFARDDLQNLDKLANGRVDLILIDRNSAIDQMVLNRPHLIGKLEFLEPALFPSAFHVAFPLGGPHSRDLLTAFNNGLAALRAQNGVKDILGRHGLGGGRTEAPGVGRVLHIATVNNSDMKTLRSHAGEFLRRTPGLAIEWHFLDEHSLRTRLMADLAMGDGNFDVMTIGSYETPIWAARGWLQKFPGLPPSYGLDDLLPAVRADVSLKGEIYALPFYGESSITYYRSDLLRQAGLTMPAQPTYADIFRLAAALNDPSHGVAGICLRTLPGWGENMTFLTPMVNVMGGRWFDEHWRPELTSPSWRRAVSFYVDILNRFGPTDRVARGFNENLALFAQGRCAIWIDATVAGGVLSDPRRSRVTNKLAYAPAPVDQRTVGGSWLWVWALAVPGSARYPEDARRFIEWATSAAYVRRVAAVEGWVAVPPGTRRSTYADPEYGAVAPFAAQTLAALLSARKQLPGRPYSGIQFVAIPEFAAIGHGVGVNIARALAGELSVDEALRLSQEQVSAQMKALGYLAR